jgi:phosphoglucosamine mutase
VEPVSLKFGTDGVRAEALTVLTTQYVGGAGHARRPRCWAAGEWLIGRDTRESGPALAAAVAAGLAAGGARSRRQRGRRCPRRRWRGYPPQRGVPAAMITASHNPWQDNGVKFFAPGGLKLPDEVERAIEAVLQPERAGCRPMHGAGRHVDARGEYAAHLASGQRASRWSGCGSCSTARTVRCLRWRAGRVPCARAQRCRRGPRQAPNGRNINDRCGATHTASLAAAVVAERCGASASRSMVTAIA